MRVAVTCAWDFQIAAKRTSAAKLLTYIISQIEENLLRYIQIPDSLVPSNYCSIRSI